MGVLNSCKPRQEVLKGDLEDAIFAADFGDLIEGEAPAVYKDAKVFFSNTFPTKELRKLAELVFGRLADKKARNRNPPQHRFWWRKNAFANRFVASCPKHRRSRNRNGPSSSRRAPRYGYGYWNYAGKAGVPIFATHGKMAVHSLGGEIFCRLGGEKAVKALGKADDPEHPRTRRKIQAALPKGPVLILLDELVIYMGKLSDRGQKNLLGFLSNLISIATSDPKPLW